MSDRFAVLPGIDPAIRRRHAVINFAQTAVLLGGMMLLVVACGWIIAGWEGLLWAAAAGGVTMALTPRISPEMILGLYRAVPLGPSAAPGLVQILDALSRRAGLPRRPRLYYVASPVLNAFAVGRRDDAAIAVTDGLLETLTPRELAGVLAHEISHIRNNDLGVMALADGVSRITRAMATFGLLLLIFNAPVAAMEGEAPVPWSVVLLLVFAPTVGALLQLALSRIREYDADLDAAHLTGDPAGLASALRKLDLYQRGVWERIFLPGRRNPDPSLLRTHPPTEERIRRLLALQPVRPMLPYATLASDWLTGDRHDRRVPRLPRARLLSGLWY